MMDIEKKISNETIFKKIMLITMMDIERKFSLKILLKYMFGPAMEEYFNSGTEMQVKIPR